MTKKEMIKKLVEEYGVESTGLNRKTVGELTEMLEKIESELITEALTEEITEEVTEVEVEEEVKQVEVEESKYIAEEDVQLGIHERVVKRFTPSRTIEVVNLGAGDLYLATEVGKLISKNNLIRPQESKQLNDVDVIIMESSSKPKVRINYIK